MQAEAGISTLGVKLGYGIGTTTVKPTDFKQLERANSIGGVSLSTEQIDASALEDLVSKYVAGRQDTGGTWEVTFNLSDSVIAQLKAMITEYQGMSAGEEMWFVVWAPKLTQSFYIIAEVPQHIPMPEIGQNTLMTGAMTLTIKDYKGLDTAVEPKAQVGA